MVQQIKTYWIALLVVVLVGLHGAIVTMVRVEAAAAKLNASSEIDLGTFRLTGSELSGPLQMRLHCLAPVNHRIQSRRLVELNQQQIRQAIEQHLRQVPSELLVDPLLVELKQQLMDIMIQTVGASAVDEVLVTEFAPVDERLSWAFGLPSQAVEHRVVITRRDEHEELKAAVEAKIAAEAASTGHGSHGGGHGESHGDTDGAGHGGHEASHGDDSHESGSSHGGSHGESGSGSHGGH